MKTFKNRTPEIFIGEFQERIHNVKDKKRNIGKMERRKELSQSIQGQEINTNKR